MIRKNLNFKDSKTASFWEWATIKEFLWFKKYFTFSWFETTLEGGWNSYKVWDIFTVIIWLTFFHFSWVNSSSLPVIFFKLISAFNRPLPFLALFCISIFLWSCVSYPIYVTVFSHHPSLLWVLGRNNEQQHNQNAHYLFISPITLSFHITHLWPMGVGSQWSECSRNPSALIGNFWLKKC